MPIRVRLTLWFTFLLGAILLAFSILLYLVLSFTLHDQVDRNLKDRAQQVGVRIEARTALMETGKVVLPSLNDFSSPDFFIQVVRADGELVSASDNLGNQPFPYSEEIHESNKKGQSLFKTLLIDDTPIRVHSAPIIIGPPNQVVGAVQVGQSMNVIDTTLQLVLLILISGTVAATLVTATGGAFLARTALRPVEKITELATQIVGAQDLKQRLPVPKVNDEMGRLTTTINNMLERLDNFFQAQIRLSADVSHELRAPLTMVRGNLDLLQHGATNDQVEFEETLDIINSELDRMSRIVADLLLLSQAEIGINLRRQPVNLSKIILEVYQQIRVMINNIDIQLGHEDYALIYGDADRLKQLLINLVTNALSRTSAGSDIILSLYRDAVWIRITVAVTGWSILPSIVAHLFERYHPLEDYTQSGAGLSLWIAQWIAHAHGGKITVVNEKQGCIFTVWLPLEAKAETEIRSLPFSQLRPTGVGTASLAT